MYHDAIAHQTRTDLLRAEAARERRVAEVARTEADHRAAESAARWIRRWVKAA